MIFLAKSSTVAERRAPGLHFLWFPVQGGAVAGSGVPRPLATAQVTNETIESQHSTGETIYRQLESTKF